MKRVFDATEFEAVIKKSNEMMMAERKEALQLFAELEDYYAGVDFSTHPTQEVHMLTALTRYRIEEREIDKAEELMNKARDIAISHDLKGEQIRVLATLGVIHSIRGDHLEAIYTWEDLMSDMLVGDFMWNMVVNNLIVAYSFTKQFSRAIDLSYQLLEYYDSVGDTDGRLVALINLGNSYRPLKDTAKAEAAYLEAISLAEEKENFPYLSYALSNLSVNLTDQERYDEALEVARKTLALHQAYFSEAHVGGSYNSIGTILLKQERYEEALENHLMAVEKYTSFSEMGEVAGAYLNLGQAYLRLNRLPEAYENLIKGRDICATLDVEQAKVNACKLLAEYYEAVGDYQKMAQEYRQLTLYQDEQFEEVTASLISKHEAEYLRKKIELQNENYRIKNKQLEESNELNIKQALELKDRNSELQTSMDTLNKLISIISHDVRGPAASTAAALRMLLEDDIPESLKHDLKKDMIRSMDSMTDLLTEILLWIQSRSYSTGIEDMMQQLEVLTLLDNALELYTGAAKRKNISITKAFIDEKVTAYTEPITLKIVLRNIISNAVKFTPEGGEIHISTRHARQGLILDIADTGVGMDRSMIAQLLKHELRSSPGTNMEHGSGMGLRLSLGYLQLLHADLEICSDPGKGTHFIITLPYDASGIVQSNETKPQS